MNNSKLVHPNRKVNWSRLAFPLGISFLFVAVLLAGFGGAATAHTDSPASPAIPQNGTVTVPSGDPIEIAVVMFDGWESAQDTYDAAQMAINDYGSIKGWNLQRNDSDGGCDPTSGENAANAIVSNAQNAGVIGFFCSGSTGGALPILETAGLVMISHGSTGTNLPSLGPTVFNRVVVSDTTIADWIVKINRLPSVRNWEADFESTYGHPPEEFAKFSYDATTLLLSHIDATSTVDGGDNLVIDRAALAAAVRGTAGFPGVTDDITLEADGERVNSLIGTGTRYIATNGSDSGGNDCTDSMAPCASVGRGIALGDGGGDILISAGTYTENLTIEGITLTLRGGYTISGTQWLSDTGETAIDGNDAGRVFFIHDNDSTLENLTITGGNAPESEPWGGGIWVTNGSFSMRQIRILTNVDGGIEVNSDYGPTHLILEGSVIGDNSGSGLNVSETEASADIVNVLIVENKGDSAVRLGSGNMMAGNLSIVNSTIAHNEGALGILVEAGGTFTLTNSIVWGNQEDELDCNGTCTVTYSDIEDGWTGTGNIDENPMFVDSVGGDYSLKFGSPCIDAGTDSGAPDHDLVGTERPQDGDGDGTKVTDMGAYEFVLSQFKLYLPITVRD
jgi:hypothetical protein